jgi:hypothetical protein
MANGNTRRNTTTSKKNLNKVSEKGKESHRASVTMRLQLKRPHSPSLQESIKKPKCGNKGKPALKKGAVILSDSESDVLSTQNDIRGHRHQSCDEDDAQSQSELSERDEDDDGGDEELEQLDDKCLKEKLTSEFALWDDDDDNLLDPHNSHSSDYYSEEAPSSMNIYESKDEESRNESVEEVEHRPHSSARSGTTLKSPANRSSRSLCPKKQKMSTLAGTLRLTMSLLGLVLE